LQTVLIEVVRLARQLLNLRPTQRQWYRRQLQMQVQVQVEAQLRLQMPTVQ